MNLTFFSALKFTSRGGVPVIVMGDMRSPPWSPSVDAGAATSPADATTPADDIGAAAAPANDPGSQPASGAATAPTTASRAATSTATAPGEKQDIGKDYN